MITVGKTNETIGGNQTQQGDLEQLSQVITRIFGGGNQTQ